jgi:large subunit ribosomal protein L13
MPSPQVWVGGISRAVRPHPGYVGQRLWHLIDARAQVCLRAASPARDGAIAEQTRASGRPWLRPALDGARDASARAGARRPVTSASIAAARTPPPRTSAQVVGKLATNIATLLIGKHKPTYVPRFDCGDHVVVVNAGDVVFTGRKWTQKMYAHHTGWPGGLKEMSAADMLRKFPDRIIPRAVRSMLPKNLLRKQRLQRLHVFAGAEHPHAAQITGSYRQFGPRWPFGPKPERWYPAIELPPPKAP